MKMGHAIYKRRYRDLLFVTLVYWCIAGFSPSPPHLNKMSGFIHLTVRLYFNIVSGEGQEGVAKFKKKKKTFSIKRLGHGTAIAVSVPSTFATDGSY